MLALRSRHLHLDHDHSGHSNGPRARDHDHDHAAQHSHTRLMVCFWITAAFMLVEAGTGLWTNSLALLSDAFHMLSDAVALGLAAAAARISLRKPTVEKPFGFKRFEILAAFANAVVLLLLSAALVVKAAARLWHPEQVVAGPMLMVAAIGLVFNLVILFWMHRTGDEKNLNESGVIWHVFGDALGSVAALAAGACLLWRGWLWVDPAASILIAGIIGTGATRLLRQSSHILVEGVPAGLDVEAVRKSMLAAPQVGEVHDLHVWTLNGRDLFLSAHVGTTPGKKSEQEVVAYLRSELEEHFGVHHITLQVGQCAAEDCGNDCDPA